MRLSEQTREALRLADSLVERDQALIALRDLVDPSGRLTAWALAGAISERLRRFQEAAWPRIARGYREPQNAVEKALVALSTADCPTSQKRLHGVLRTIFR